MAENKTEKTWFTKTIAREAVEEATKALLAENRIDVETQTLLNNLFAGCTVATNTMVKDSEGNIVMKRCSYFEGYLPIDEFGTVGKDDEGNVKYSYQSKLGAACQRKAKTELANAISEADEQLEVDEDVAAWKEAKAEAVKASEEKCEYDGENILIATYEDACEAVA